MTRRQSNSVSARLTRMNLLVSGAVLLIACAAFFSYDLVSFRQKLIQNLDVESQIVGDNSVAALTFNDSQSATSTLASLQRSPDVLAATLTAADGSTFARYGTLGSDEVASHKLSAGDMDHVWSSGTKVLLAHRIVFKGQSVGTVYIWTTLSEIGQRARRYALIAGAILLVCMVAGLIIGSASRRLIAQPITALADTALLVSRERDYSVRASVHTDSNEITVLVEAFNTMLAQIQQRDIALNQARSNLETRVQERTAELQAANRELEAFSYTVAHDLRGPLDAINTIAFLLNQSSDDTSDPHTHLMLNQLRTSAANMGVLIDDLLNFARASTSLVQSTPVNLSDMASKIASELTMTDPARSVEFQIADTPEALADPGLMRIVLDNLLRNSWKYTSHHSRACIEFGAKQVIDATRGTSRFVYFVRDDGAGFDPAQKGRLFQPFQRLHDKSAFSGTGIGLATVQRILIRQAGSIWAEGEVEKGATFYFTLG